MFGHIDLEKLVTNDGSVTVVCRSFKGKLCVKNGMIYIPEVCWSDFIDHIYGRYVCEHMLTNHYKLYPKKVETSSEEFSITDYVKYVAGCVKEASGRNKLSTKVTLFNFTEKEVLKVFENKLWRCSIVNSKLLVDWGIMTRQERKDLKYTVREELSHVTFEHATASIILHNPARGFEQSLKSYQVTKKDDVFHLDFKSFTAHKVLNTDMIVVTFQY